MNKKEYLLTKLAEECNEVAQRVSKALCFGLEEIQNGQGLTNAQRIEMEYIDLMAVYGILVTEGFVPEIDQEKFVKLMEAKVQKIQHYMGYSEHCGTLRPDKLKLMVCGHGRHGKDTLCEFLQTKGYNFISSSMASAEIFIFEALKEKYGYQSIQECWDDRVNHRAEWYDLICGYNSSDPTNLAREIYNKYDIYCGIRNPIEFSKAKEDGLFELSIWVDALGRLPAEGMDSNGITKDMCDIIISNNGTLEEFMSKIENFYNTVLKR